MSSFNEKPEGFFKGITRIFFIEPIKKCFGDSRKYFETSNQMHFGIHHKVFEDNSSKAKKKTSKKRKSKKGFSKKKSSPKTSEAAIPQALLEKLDDRCSSIDQ